MVFLYSHFSLSQGLQTSNELQQSSSYTGHSSLFILGWIKSLSNASDLSSSWDFNRFWHLFSRKWLDPEFQFHNRFWLEGWQCGFVNTTRHFGSRLKYLKNYWMDDREILYRHPRFPEDEAYSLWWLMSPWGLAVWAFFLWMSQQPLDGLSWNVALTFMAPSR